MMSTHSEDSRDETDLQQLAKKYLDRILPDHPAPTERYYDIRILAGEKRTSYFGEVGDQCLMFHTNKVCILTLSPTHPVIQSNKTITKVGFEFEGYEFIDRCASKPQGKSKKGSQKMHKNSPVCFIECSDGSKYCVTACLNSRLLEINEELILKPQLMQDYPLSKGYIAIMQPNNWKLMNEMRQSLPKLAID